MPMWMNMLLRTLAWKIILYDDGIVATVLSWFGATDVQLIYTPGAVLIATIYDFFALYDSADLYNAHKNRQIPYRSGA